MMLMSQMVSSLGMMMSVTIVLATTRRIKFDARFGLDEAYTLLAVDMVGLHINVGIDL